MIPPRDREDFEVAEEPIMDEEEPLLDDETPLEDVIEEVPVAEMPVAILVSREALPDIVPVAINEAEFAAIMVLPGELDADDAEDDPPWTTK